MIMITGDELKKIYNDCIMQKFDYKNINSDVIRIDTPFFDRHNDSVIIYAILDNNNSITLTDGGYVLDDLESNGIHILRSEKRRKILLTQLKAYGVILSQNNQLQIVTNQSNYANDKHRILQAMLFTNDMFMLDNKTTSSVFFEDVASFLENNNIRAFHNVSFVGASGMNHKFEFSIPGIREIPDRLIKILNSPNNEMYAKALTADVRNTSDVVTRPTVFYTFINDIEKEIKPDVLGLLQYEDINVVPFSRREEFIAELVK